VDHKHQSGEDLGGSEDETLELISGKAIERVPDSEPNIAGQSVQPSLITHHSSRCSSLIIMFSVTTCPS
jgi:hypothetical protein